MNSSQSKTLQHLTTKAKKRYVAKPSSKKRRREWETLEVVCHTCLEQEVFNIPPALRPPEESISSKKQKVPLKLPSFEGEISKEPAVFIQYLEQTLKWAGVPRTAWVNALANTMTSETLVDFYKLVWKSEDTPWEEVTQTFIKRFACPYAQEAAIWKLIRLRHRRNQPVEEFVREFRRLLADTEADETNPLVVACLVRAVQLQHRGQVLHELRRSEGSLASALDLLVHIGQEELDQQPRCSLYNRRGHSSDSGRQNPSKSKASTHKRSVQEEKRRILCYNCRRPGHKAMDCPMAKRGPISDKSAGLEITDSTSKQV